MKRLIAFLLITSLFGIAPAFAVQKATKNPKLGQFCAKKEFGLKIKNLQCTYEGNQYRWSSIPNATNRKTTQSGNTVTKMPNKEFKFMSDYLAALRKSGVECSDYVKDSDPGMGARENGTCNWNGQKLTLTLGAGNNSQMKELINAFKSLITGYVLLKQNWMISLEDGSSAKLLSEKLGMEVV